MFTTIPKTMKALVQQENHTAAVAEISVPTPAVHELLVKVDHVALNPADWKFVDMIAKPGNSLGFDFSGHIVQLPTTPLKPNSLSIGDRVGGYVLGGFAPDKGSFAQYLRVRPDLVWKAPAKYDGVKGVGYGAAFGTAAQSIYYHMGIPFPGKKVEGSPWMFIYGGSTSLGLFAIQLAKLAGYRVVVACSPKSFGLVKQYGADEAVDYHDGSAASEAVRKITANSLLKAYDCISDESSIKLTLDTFSTEKGEKKLVTVASPNEALKAVAAKRNISDSACNALALCGMNDSIDPDPHREFYAKVCSLIPDFIEKYSVRPVPVKELEGGLGGINAGFDLFRAGKVSGEKLILKI